MATNTLNTRIRLKYDTLSNWNSSSFIPLAGEMCVAVIPNTATNDNTVGNPDSSGLSPYAIGIKVGDGQRTFLNLPWIQAIAGDVYGWAKQSSIVNNLTETDLTNLINRTVSDTNTTYQIVKGTGANLNKYYLQKKEINDNDFSYVNIDQNNNPIPFLDLSTITGATRFIGVSTSAITNGSTNDRPTINNIEITSLTAGDIVIYQTAEFIWDGTQWNLLGDESKQIIDTDVAVNANISPSKINGLSAALDKLNNIAAGAQVNTIEKIQVPDGNSYKDLSITDNKAVQLSAIAETGSIYDVIEHNTITENNVSVNYLVFDCGDATHLITNPT